MIEHEVPGVEDIAVFVAVADHGSFTRAAERLGTGKSSAGKAVQRLEAQLGTRLFQRTTRAVRLTEDGETYLQAARAALEGLADAERALAARRDEPVGRVRLALPVGLGRLLLPTLASLREKHPKVTLEISLSDRRSDAVAEGWDLVVRIGELPDEGEMTVRKLCSTREGLYASPEYLGRRGPVSAIHELHDHDAAIFRGYSGALRPWKLNDGGRIVEVVPRSPAIILSDGQALLDAAVSGLGIAQMLDKFAQPHVCSGRLREVLPDTGIKGPPIHALVPLGRRIPCKTRVVLEHLAEVLKRPAPMGDAPAVKPAGAT
ncbi:MAG: LysR family transcriptional regulator [Parvibaculaceae bacterium]|nr:LysR family transcriptional regulator [Parvibaculaceae bacterium]